METIRQKNQNQPMMHRYETLTIRVQQCVSMSQSVLDSPTHIRNHSTT